MTPIRLTVNGERREAAVDPRTTLLHFLREELHLTGTKESCAEGECGACTVWLDGRVANACLILAVEVDGASLTTIEGLRAAAHPLIDALARAGGVQCGFCIPGMVMSAASLLEGNPTPTADEVRAGLAGNLCRCTGYQKIVEAVLDLRGRVAPDRRTGSSADPAHMAPAPSRSGPAEPDLRLPPCAAKEDPA